MEISQEQLNNSEKSPLLKDNIKVALVHDFLVQQGGAEKVLETLAEMFPEAPIYTLLYDKEKMRGMFKGKDIRPSYLQKFPKFLRKRYQWLLPFFPIVPETFDLRDFDLVISSSGAWSKGIVTKLNTIHIAYLHSPMRFVWDRHSSYLKEEKKKFPSFLVRMFLTYLRIWDRLAADRPDYLIANSKYTQQRVEKYYRRESTIIYPPVDIKSQNTNNKTQTNTKSQIQNLKNIAGRDEAVPRLYDGENYFLIVSRLSPYKKVDLAIETFNKLELHLVIIGEGKQEKYLRKIAGKNITILGWRSDEVVKKYYRNARAFLFPAEDDFGMTMVEAMSCGAPVIAFEKGGAKEIVEQGVTGEFFGAQTVEVTADGVRRFMENEGKYDKNVIMNKAKEFSKEKFISNFSEYIKEILKQQDTRNNNQKN